MTDRMDINRVLTEMRSMRSQVQPFAGQGQDALGRGVLSAKDVGESGVVHGQPTGLGRLNNNKEATGFGELFEKAISGVNETQQASAALAKSYEQGAPGVDITDVMVASQKASVSFQAMVQVRNKLIDSYRDVMNMPI